MGAMHAEGNRWLAAAGLGLLLLFVQGCPRDLEDPSRGSTEPCETLSDCNADAGTPPCGLLRAWVDQRCEVAPSVPVPCGAP